MTKDQLPVLSAAQARAAAEAAMQIAEELGASISVAVVDARGHDVLVVRADHAAWFTPGVARTKAATSAAMGRATRDLTAMSEAFPELLPLVAEQLPHPVTTLPGGVPLRVGGLVIGAIGVSGAHPDVDEQCAQRGAHSVAPPADV